LNRQGLFRPVKGLLYLYLAIPIKDQMEIRKVNAAELSDWLRSRPLIADY